MKLVSWNVNGVRAIQQKGFAESVRSLNPDVICLQETKATPEQVAEAVNELEEYEVHALGAERKGYSGTAILSKKKVESVKTGIGIEEHDQEGRVITADLGSIYLVTVYTPNSGQGLKRLSYREQWDQDFLQYMLDLEKQKPVVICGDLNVCHQAIDIARPKPNYNKSAGYTQIEIDGFQALVDNGFVDTFRTQHPDEVKYSWWSFRGGARQKNIGWRLDYFLISQALAPKMGQAEIINEIMGSDHCPVSLQLEL